MPSKPMLILIAICCMTVNCSEDRGGYNHLQITLCSPYTCYNEIQLDHNEESGQCDYFNFLKGTIK
jgi:hypothetical protein